MTMGFRNRPISGDTAARGCISVVIVMAAFPFLMWGLGVVLSGK